MFILLAAGRPAEAEAEARVLLAALAKAGPDTYQTADGRSMLGAALAAQGKAAEAEPLLVAGFTGLRDRQADLDVVSRRRELQEALDRLVDFYRQQNRPAHAAKWKAEEATLPNWLAPQPRPVP